MAANQFYPFATAGGAFVLNNAAYLALAARSTGWPTGLLTKENLNSALRQGSFVAAALSQWVATLGVIDVNDDGVIANWTAAYTAAYNIQWKNQLNGTFKVFAGNPNGLVAGVQGVAGVTFPSVVWDINNNIWWVCRTTGNAAAAVWVEAGAFPAWPMWCGTSAGTANGPVLTTPPEMVVFANGTGLAWKIGVGPNTGAVAVTVGAFGTVPLLRDGPTGPTPLTGGELDVGNLVAARFDGVSLHLTATELGTAAMADATSNTGKVNAMSGVAVVGNLPIFTDVPGTLIDSGLTPGDIISQGNGIMYQLGLAQ